MLTNNQRILNEPKRDPETENDFNVAYKKVNIYIIDITIQLIKKLEKEEGGNILIPEEDIIKL